MSARLAQSVEHETLNLRGVGSSPSLGGVYFSFFICISFFQRQSLATQVGFFDQTKEF